MEQLEINVVTSKAPLTYPCFLLSQMKKHFARLTILFSVLLFSHMEKNSSFGNMEYRAENCLYLNLFLG